jgi:hypothetical protein
MTVESHPNVEKADVRMGHTHRLFVMNRRISRQECRLYTALIRARPAAVLLQPLQFFADFDFSVPGIFVERMAFAGKDQQVARNIQFM